MWKYLETNIGEPQEKCFERLLWHTAGCFTFDGFKKLWRRSEIGALLLFFMLLKSAILCELYLLTCIICAIETPCDANLFLPFVSIHFFNSRCYFLKDGYAIEKFWTTIEGDARAASHDNGAGSAIEIVWSRPSFGDVASATSHDTGARNAIEIVSSRPTFWDDASGTSHDFGARNAIEIFPSRPTFGDVASGASHDIRARNAIENFLKSTKLWRCCEWRWSRCWRKKCDWNFSKSTKLWRCCEWR